MANVKISDLTPAGAASGTQEFEVNDSLSSKSVTGAQIAAYTLSTLDSTDISGAGGLLAANNLSDIAVAATARTNLGLGTAAVSASTDFVGQTGTTASGVLPVGTTAQRDGSPVNGYIRFNTTLTQFEGYNGSAWGAIGGGGYFKGENGTVGGSTGAGDIFRVNEQALNTNVTIDADENASAAGPLTIASGVTLTITSGGSVSIV